MSADVLTRHNPLLSRVTMADVGASGREIELTFTAPPTELVADYVRESLADNTRRAYLSDLAHFERWGGSVPASANEVASYLADHAETLFERAKLFRHQDFDGSVREVTINGTHPRNGVFRSHFECLFQA